MHPFAQVVDRCAADLDQGAADAAVVGKPGATAAVAGAPLSPPQVGHFGVGAVAGGGGQAFFTPAVAALLP